MSGELVKLDGTFDLTQVGPMRALTTIDTSEQAGRIAFLRSMGKAEFTLKELSGAEILVRDVTVYWAPYPPGEDGEFSEGPRAVLIAPDGTRVSTTSPYAIRCALEPDKFGLAKLPYDPPVRFKVCRHKGSVPGHEFFTLEIVGVG